MVSQPERIDPQRARGYDVRSDVWSLGITLMEVATGKFPYPKWGSVFEQLYQVRGGEEFSSCFEIIIMFLITGGPRRSAAADYVIQWNGVFRRFCGFCKYLVSLIIFIQCDLVTVSFTSGYIPSQQHLSDKSRGLRIVSV